MSFQVPPLQAERFASYKVSELSCSFICFMILADTYDSSVAVPYARGCDLMVICPAAVSFFGKLEQHAWLPSVPSSPTHTHTHTHNSSAFFLVYLHLRCECDELHSNYFNYFDWRSILKVFCLDIVCALRWVVILPFF